MKLDDPAVAEIIPHAFTPEEVEWAEANYPALAADQPENFCTAFDSLDAIRFMELTAAALDGVAKEFECASAWHRARGRVELSEKYRLRAENLRVIVNERLN